MPALLRTGIVFDAVRLPAYAVHQHAGSGRREDVVRAFSEAGARGGAVVVDSARRWYYALVPPGTAAGWDEPGTEALGMGCVLGVPAPGRGGPPGSYWLAGAPRGPEGLCVPGAVRVLGALPAAG
ncbi:hypothetical protein [Streptomyces telluris]|uniref:Uncharacterized protein n=1 Tax=Streptomyces telluris TaxID=2720021 RepID=A0A9X2LDE6_9ACTN|nr:hypothetical protein [Streptomyces telluris]MCQ8768922.1 hypothetical protein [Streptomyces telluris]NJP77647.1 hypothetical protein [Streptomyces telluris]